MSVLVIGASGQLGGNLMEALRASRQEVHGTCWRHPLPGLLALDIRDGDALHECLERLGVEVVYLAAALSNVDYCEAHPDESYAVNVAPAQQLARSGVRIVFFSSDYVFAGDSGPYRESDRVQPLSIYGQHKVDAERALPETALIVRTTVVYGAEAQRKNFIYRLVDTLQAGHELCVPDDQIGNPSYAPNVADAVVHLERQRARGTYNVCGPARVSRYEFAREAAMVFGLDGALVRPIATANLGQAARRPLNAGLVTDKVRAILPFPLLDYRTGLREFHADMAAGTS